MPGIRLGVCYASKEIITILNRIKPPYNVNELTQQKAKERLLNFDAIEKEISQIKNERVELENALKTVDFIDRIYESDANFILIKVDDASKRYQQLISKGIVIRNRTNEVLCDNCLRITVGTKKENEKLIKVLQEIK